MDFSAFVTHWEVKYFSAENRGFSAVMTCEKSMSADNYGFSDFMTLWEVKCFSEGNRGF